MYCIGNIYQIVYNEDANVRYIGSTFKKIKNRFSDHKCNYKQKDYKKSRTSTSLYKYLDKYGVDNFSILPIKSYLVYREHKFDWKHLRVYEQLWISKLKCINENNTFQIHKLSWKDYGQRNKEQISIRNKIYRKKNKQKIKERKARKGICECGQTINLDHKARHIKTDKHIYNMMSDEEKKNYKPLKIKCSCGSMIRKDETKRHERTQKHIKYLESLN